MKRTVSITVVITVTITLIFIGLAVAQTGVFAGLAQPILVTIDDQAVPVDVTITIPQADDTTITAIVPLTVGIRLQVKIDGTTVVAVAPAETAPAMVHAETVAAELEELTEGGQTVDTAGILYAPQVPDDLVITQVISKKSFTGASIVGQIENVGDKTYSFILLNAPLYDANGVLLDVGSGVGLATSLAPGEKTTSTVLITVAYADIASYELQIEGM